MKSISAGILIVVFGLLACLHLYWAAGGRWGLEHAAPVNEQGKKFLRTGVAACLIVAAGLVLFSIYYLVLPSGMLGSIGWIIPVIFLLRAIGDFRYVGFTKKIKAQHLLSLIHDFSHRSV